MKELNSEHWSNICQQVTNVAVPILKIKFNTRLRSEIISSLFEMEAERYYKSIGYRVRSALTDKDPDLLFEDMNRTVEVKVTKEKPSIKWMGNNVSKRSSDFVLVVWNEYDDYLQFTVSKTYLTPDDWEKSKKNFNASFLSLKNIKNKEDLIVNQKFFLQ